ncbi:hypothetical protein D3C84_530150 [compost metagenome]
MSSLFHPKQSIVVLVPSSLRFQHCWFRFHTGEFRDHFRTGIRRKNEKKPLPPEQKLLFYHPELPKTSCAILRLNLRLRQHASYPHFFELTNNPINGFRTKPVRLMQYCFGVSVQEIAAMILPRQTNRNSRQLLPFWP